jgi:hypothetical protein
MHVAMCSDAVCATVAAVLEMTAAAAAAAAADAQGVEHRMVEPLPNYCDAAILRQNITDTVDLLDALDAKLQLLEQQQQRAAAAAAAVGGAGPMHPGMLQGGMDMQGPGATAQMQQLQEMQQEQMMLAQQQQVGHRRQAPPPLQQPLPQQQRQQGGGMPPPSPDGQLLEGLLSEGHGSPFDFDLESPAQEGPNPSLNRAASADTPRQQAAKRKAEQQEGQGEQGKQAKQAQATAAATAAAAAADYADEVYDPPGGVEGQPDMSVAVDGNVKSAAAKVRNLINVRNMEPGAYYLDQVSAAWSICTWDAKAWDCVA